MMINNIVADTRLILEASKSKHPVDIRASDTDVLVIRCYTHQQLSPENDWFIKTDSERNVSATSTKLYFGEIVCPFCQHTIVLQDVILHILDIQLIK